MSVEDIVRQCHDLMELKPAEALAKARERHPDIGGFGVFPVYAPLEVIHAAGLLPYFNMSYAVSHIHDYSIRTYEALEAETGLNVGFKRVGNLRMAQSRERMDEYQLYASTAETVGVPFEWMSPDDVKARWPLVRQP